MIVIAIVIGCIIGALIGMNAPVIPYTYSTFLAIAVVAALDSVFGGITIKVPDNVIVKPIGTPIFGGVENRATQNKDSKITIHVNYTCIFGGIEIR